MLIRTSVPSVANWTVASTSTMELDVVTAAELSSEEAFKTKDTSPTGVSRISIATPGPKARKDANTVGFRNVCKKGEDTDMEARNEVIKTTIKRQYDNLGPVS